MKIYTKTGDAGDTGLYGGQRVPKDDARVEAYGTVDELSAAIGVAVSCLVDEQLRSLLTELQSQLFTLGADLATPLDRNSAEGGSPVPRIEPSHTEHLEVLIDKFEIELRPLRQFIVPGGSPAAAHLHLARTIARRAERRAVTLTRHSPRDVNTNVVPYLNRLNDLLFVLARVANHRAGISDIPWARLTT